MCIYAIADEKCRSELGLSVYESTSCEQLADQYAARCGAGRHLVVAMDKLHRFHGSDYGSSPLASISRALFMQTAYSALNGMYIAFLAPVVGLGFMAFAFTVLTYRAMQESQQSLEASRYDDFYQRLERIYHQMVQQLKNEKLKPKVLKALLEELDAVNKTLEPLRKSEAGGKSHQLGHYVALVFSSVYRKRINSEQLQQQLEGLANNPLFVQAAKLKTL